MAKATTTPRKRTTKASTSKTTTTRKRATTSTKTTAKAKPKAAPKPEPVVVKETAPVVTAADMKKVQLIDAVVERSGVKKKYAKPAIEAALAVLGEALAEGQGLNLRPLGKVKIQRQKDVSNGRVITVRVRQPLDKKEADKPLAEPAE